MSLSLQCVVDTLCGVSIPQPLQDALTLLTDFCSIVAECQVCDEPTRMKVDSVSLHHDLHLACGLHPLLEALASAYARISQDVMPE